MKKNRIPHFRTLSIWMQLTLLVSLIVGIAFGFIIYTTYTRQVHSFVEEYRESTQTILDMESSNLEQYIKDLRAFCVRPCLNVPVYNAFLKAGAISPDDQTAIKQEIQSEFHSRTDLLSYAISVLGAGLRFERPKSGQHVLIFSSGDVKSSTAYQACGESSKYEYLAPPSDEGAFFRYYHYLIRLKGRTPISLSRVDIDMTELQLMLSNHREEGEAFCVFNGQGELLYSNLNDPGMEPKRLYQAAQKQDSLMLHGSKYLLTHAQSSNNGLLLLSVLPQSVLSDRAKVLLHPMLVSAVLILAILIAVITIVLHMLTDPLARLSAQMSRMGEGDFSPLSSRGGCRESDELTGSYNTMTKRLNELIETNYISTLNEKNARLKTLEAQLNPHFLYNTLQAIGTEALVSGSPEVYDMIVSLAGNLRYSIKGDKLVPLSSEMTYVHNYILLQKTRLQERLVVEERIAESVKEVLIPKISIQILVENAILHGMPSDGTPLHLTISAENTEDGLRITVLDDGVGITPERMAELNFQLDEQNQPLTESTDSIGLMNLAGRLRILYQGKASLTVDSVEGEYTSVTMQIHSKEEPSERTE